jgi:signal transduction histidine kinase/ActR/RegA family two-component response regulator
MTTGRPPDPGGNAAGVWPLILAAAAVVFMAGAAAWLAFAPPEGEREAGRTYTVWHASQAVTAYNRLRRAIVSAQRSSGTDPDGINNIRALATTFTQTVTRVRDGHQTDPVVDALISRLDADQKQILAAIRQLDDPAAAPLPNDSTELAQLSEAVNQDTAVRVEHDEYVTNRQRLIVAGIVAALVAIGLWLMGLLWRKSQETGALRRALGDLTFQLREARDAAGRADAARARLISTTSHDLRAPMDAVLSLTDSLLEERSSPAQREITARIRDAGGNVLRALDDVLDFTTLESGGLTLDERPFSPEAVTAAAVQGIEAQARAKGLTIVAIPAPGLPRLLLGDADRIARILFRLAANAVKYTDKGGVSLQVLCVDRVYEQATIEWVVTDSGKGIDPARLDNLFGTEEQAEDAGGTGLGLAVCKRLVVRMGGSISVESAPGEGARFRVRVPFGVTSAVATGARPPASQSAASLRNKLRDMGRRPRVLMAEDTPAGQFILRQLLAREGIAPEMVADGRAAVIAAEADRYDVICMDLKMPEMDGLEAARRIRSGRGPSARTPIIAVTASTSPGDVRACRDAGMNMFVAKPVRREALLDAILAALMQQEPGYDPSIGNDTGQAVI